MAARSFVVREEGQELERALVSSRAGVEAPSGGLLFVSGTLARAGSRLADLVRTHWRGVPTVVAPGAGVLTERGEIEGQNAAAGLLWSGGRATPFAHGGVSEPGAEGQGVSLGEEMRRAAAGRPGAALVFPRSDFDPSALEGLAEAVPDLRVFGGGTVGGAAFAVTASGDVLTGSAAGVVLTHFAPPLVVSSPACRLLAPLAPIEEATGGLVTTVGGRPALDVLAACIATLRGEAAPASNRGAPPPPVLFAALADDPDDDTFVVRSLRGVDTAKKGVMIGAEATVGARLGFAVRDATAARNGLEAQARELARSALGSAPRFAVYIACAGRGQGLYGAPDVEARLLRQRFGDLPIAGLHSAFEIAPRTKSGARVALYTGVLALFRSPS